MTSTWRDERRQDRLSEAQIRRDDLAARSKLRAAEAKAAQDRRMTARKARAARRSALGAWCGRNVADLLLAPVIAVSVVLSWSSVATFGVWLFGPAGHAFPIVPDGGMWACAVAVTIHRRMHPGEPAWKWQAGTAFFAGVTATTNFLHGYTTLGVAAGIAMALVSVSGLAAHQLVTASPQRPLADRRARTAERVATRRAKFAFDGSGSARLVHEAGVAVMTRKRGRVVLTIEPAKPQVSIPIEGSVETTAEPAVVSLPAAPTSIPAMPPAEPVAPAPDEPRNEPPAAVPAEPPAPARSAPPATRRHPSARPARPKTDTVTALIKAGVSNTEIVKRTGLSLATVKRRRSAFKASGGNVVQIVDRRRA